MNNQSPRIQTKAERYFVGMNIKTNLLENKTHELWSNFMPRKKKINSIKGDALFSMQEYPSGLAMTDFTPQTIFTKWAAVEVSSLDNLPEGMNSLIIPESKYAIFSHKGPASTFHLTAQYIYSQWLPSSGYSIPDLPHFEVMGDKYLGHDNPATEEEVWIPIR